MAIDTTKIIAEVGVDGVDMQLKAPTGIIDITENGTVDVTNYATANVNVSGGSSTNKFAQLVDRSITEVTVDDLADISIIGEYAFSDCSSLTTITIHGGVIIIGGSAFNKCRSLNSVVYEGQVPDILPSTFYNCSNVQLYDFRNCTTVPSLANTRALGHAAGCQIVIPDALYDEWQQATNWSSLTNVVWVKSSEYVEG